MKYLLALVLSVGLIISLAHADEFPFYDRDQVVHGGNRYSRGDSGYRGNQNYEGQNYNEEQRYNENSYSNQGQIVCERPSRHQTEDDKLVARRAYEITNGVCDFRTNPHSYECTHVTFKNLLFPFFQIDWWGYEGTPWNMQGEWVAVTYVESAGKENSGDSFYMEKNPHNTNQPLGVQNRNYGPMGSMWISDNVVIFQNWQGKELVSIPESLQIYQDHVLFQMDELVVSKKYNGRTNRMHVIHFFDCVNFNRHNTMHLQCSWDVKVGKNNRKHMGYFGFLTRPAWDKFLYCKKQ